MRRFCSCERVHCTIYIGMSARGKQISMLRIHSLCHSLVLTEHNTSAQRTSWDHCKSSKYEHIWLFQSEPSKKERKNYKDMDDVIL